MGVTLDIPDNELAAMPVPEADRDKMKSVFIVQHLHMLPQDTDEVKMIGVYATREDAVEATQRLAALPGFREFPDIVDYTTDNRQGFHIEEYEIGKDHWQEGYSTV